MIMRKGIEFHRFEVICTKCVAVRIFSHLNGANDGFLLKDIFCGGIGMIQIYVRLE